jgi:isopenicillin N synthase-like dioxygenase
VKLHPGFIGPNIWPPTSLIPDSVFKDPCEVYYQKMLDLCAVILQILAAGLPYGPHLFDEFLANDPLASLRLLRYPPTDAAGLGAGAHTDFGAITLLLQDQHAGLQVQDPETKEWIDIPPNRDAYVVNIGDMMERWTRGLYKSNLHRVINKGKEERFSVPFFFDGNLDCRLVPFDGDEERSEREGWGKAMTVEEQMSERFASTYGKA